MISLKIEGMTCNHCVMAVKNALESVPGTSNVKVDLEKGLATLESGANTADLISAVEEEGYKASLLNG